MKLAAIGDIHTKEDDQKKIHNIFKLIPKGTDALLLCGDLTNMGKITEAKVLSDELKKLSLPVVAVLGNHDYENELQKSITDLLRINNVSILDGNSFQIDKIGFAGVKGFCGGYDGKQITPIGEKILKDFIQETVFETEKLDNAISKLNSEKKVILLHYSPIKETLFGESEELYPFLGASRLESVINKHNVTAVFHGHAHNGRIIGKTKNNIPVYNSSFPLLYNNHPYKPFVTIDVSYSKYFLKVIDFLYAIISYQKPEKPH
jgi:Icc-related predicted phosphoesterase